jgi:signal recognition particle subunit SRP54
MFEQLREGIGGVFRGWGKKGRLTEKDIDEGLRQMRRELLAADVNLRVAKELIERVKERSLQAKVMLSLTPAQQITKIAYEELTFVLGGEEAKLVPQGDLPYVTMLVGLQGSGKTTTAAKLSLYLKRSGGHPLLSASDTQRPGAREQLLALGKAADIPVYSDGQDSLDVCLGAKARAREGHLDWVVIDTQGRLHIDSGMMEELSYLRDKLSPCEILLVLDAMTGQEGVRIAEEFHRYLKLTGVILTKLDGDARGGAALSVKEAIGIPIKFIGIGERPDDLEVFHPPRIASRILGRGDIETIIEHAQESVDEEKAKLWEKKLKKGSFDLNDFLEELRGLKGMGPLDQLLELVPGLPSHNLIVDERRLSHVEAIILSMTPKERREPRLLDANRKRRIAWGSGTTILEVNQLLSQFEQTRKLSRRLTSSQRRLFQKVLKFP